MTAKKKTVMAKRVTRNNLKNLTQIGHALENVLSSLKKIEYEAINNTFKINNQNFPNDDYTMSNLVIGLEEFKNLQMQSVEAIDAILLVVEKFDLINNPPVKPTVLIEVAPPLEGVSDSLTDEEAEPIEVEPIEVDPIEVAEPEDIIEEGNDPNDVVFL